MSAPYAPPADAADLAERALVGGLLWDSGRVRDVREWLCPEDLQHWKARAIYATLVGLDREGRSLPVTELYAVIAGGTYHDNRPGAVTAVDLHTYLRATPATPPASGELSAHLVRSHHVIYARRVLEAAARRMVTVAGSRIQQATELSRQRPDVGDRDIAAALAATQQRLAELGNRLRHAQESPGSVITAALSGPVPDAPAVGFETTWPGPPLPPLTTRAILDAEREVLATCLLTGPSLRAKLLGWLRPDDFSRPEHAATWAAFGALAQARTPIDYVTVAWECERHNLDYDSPGLPADQLATMAAHTPGLPARATYTVAHASLLRHTDTARHQVQALAEDRVVDAPTMVSAAQQAYREVEEHARRLTGTTTAVSRASATLTSPGAPSGIPPPSPTPPPARAPDDPPQRDHRRSG